MEGQTIQWPKEEEQIMIYKTSSNTKPTKDRGNKSYCYVRKKTSYFKKSLPMVIYVHVLFGINAFSNSLERCFYIVFLHCHCTYTTWKEQPQIEMHKVTGGRQTRCTKNIQILLTLKGILTSFRYHSLMYA
jgi:hypothetical protein